MNTARLRKAQPVAPASAVIGADGQLNVEALLAFHRGLHGAARMEETDEEKAAREAKEKEARESKTYTQAELDRMLAREKDQGERAGKTQGMRDALTALGVDPDKVKPEDLKDTLTKALAADEAQKTEAQKAKDAADARELAAKAREDAAAEKELRISVERALERAGVGASEEDDEKRQKLLDKAVRLVDVEVGADSAKIKTAVESLKDDMPQLFTAASTEEPGLPGGDPGAPSRNAGGGGKGKDAQARGKALAAELGWAKQPDTKTA